MNRDVKTVVEWARAQTADGAGAPPRVLEAIDRLTPGRRRSPRKDLGPDRKAQRREERKMRAETIRAAVFARARGLCECCSAPGPTEWHHLISGGLRRTMESEETTAALCRDCHRFLHDNDRVCLQSMWRWANDRGYSAALKAIEHRLDKLSEAQNPTRRAAP